MTMELEKFTEMKIFRLVLDPNTNSPIVVLQDEKSGNLLPIWIGFFEAHSIAMKLEGVESPRPMTHDLLANTFTAVDGFVTRIEVVDLVDNTYFARILFSLNDKQYSLDSRPSDALALATRTESPIFVADHVLEHSKIDPNLLEEHDDDDDDDDWTRILKNFNPGDEGEKLN